MGRARRRHGHSSGGVYVRFFAAAFPDEVAGIVLLDAQTPHAGPPLSAGQSVESPSTLWGLVPQRQSLTKLEGRFVASEKRCCRAASASVSGWRLVLVAKPCRGVVGIAGSVVGASTFDLLMLGVVITLSSERARLVGNLTRTRRRRRGRLGHLLRQGGDLFRCRRVELGAVRSLFGEFRQSVGELGGP